VFGVNWFFHDLRADPHYHAAWQSRDGSSEIRNLSGRIAVPDFFEIPMRIKGQ
jgi:hypothetical protein